MANECLPQVQACAIRVARLEANGVPDPGAMNLYTAKVIELTMTPATQAGEAIRVIDGCGEPIVDYKEPDTVSRYGIELMISNPDVELTELLVGGLVETSGIHRGYGAPDLNTAPNENGVSIELWAKNIQDGIQDPEKPWNWWVWPRVRGLRWGPRRFFNGALENAFVGGEAIENQHWHNGPLNNWPISSDRAFHYISTTTIPAVNCGYQTLTAS